MTKSINSKDKIIYLATDHAGFELKNFIKGYLLQEGFNIKDMGAKQFDENDDFPIYIKKAAKEVSINPEESLAIIFGGSGQGEAMCANRFANVRATVYYGGPMKIVKLSKQHNDANILSIGARFVSKRRAKKAVKTWLSKKLSKDERYKRRIEMF